MNFDNFAQFYVKRVKINEERMCKYKKLDDIASLSNGWNGANAAAFSKSIIDKVRKTITTLEI